MITGATYQKAGVDIGAGNRFALMIKERIAAEWPEAAQEIGGFSGRFNIPDRTKQGNICADGPGTLAILAALTGKFHIAGIAAVAMSAVDCYVTRGFKPTALVDIIGTEKLDPDRHITIIDGIIDACKQSDCILLGGETAELPGLYKHPWMFYIDTVVVGLSDERISYTPVRPGHRVYAWPSYGLGANGFSLARKVFRLNDKPSVVRQRLQRVWKGFDSLSLAEALLNPVPIWIKPIENQRKRGVLFSGHAHITGGGLVENIPRILPPDLKVELTRGLIMRPLIFSVIEKLGQVELPEMERVFNNGVMVVSIVDPAGPFPDDPNTYYIGQVLPRKGTETQVELIGDYVT